LGHKILHLGLVGLGWSSVRTIFTQETDYSTTIIHNDKKL